MELHDQVWHLKREIRELEIIIKQMQSDIEFLKDTNRELNTALANAEKLRN